MNGPYQSASTAHRIARRYANQRGTPFAVVGYDGLAVIRWYVMPATAAQCAGTEAGHVVHANKRKEVAP